MKQIASCALALLLGCVAQSGFADSMDDFHALRNSIDTALLDIYGDSLTDQTTSDLRRTETALKSDLAAPGAREGFESNIPYDSKVPLAAFLGSLRASMQHAAALETLDHLRSGDAAQAEAWRVMISLPQFANADDGGLLLQQAAAGSLQPQISEALAKEYVTWQVTRVRQLLDALQHAIASDSVDAAFLAASLSEVQTLSHFPETIVRIAGLTGGDTFRSPLPVLSQPYNSEESVAQLSAWREGLEETLPNLLKPTDVTRLERLLVRFISVVPKEYHNGVSDGRILIALEYQEAVQFVQQAQGLVNELAPTWRRDLAGPYRAQHSNLVGKLATLAKQIDQTADGAAVETSAKDVLRILEGDFGLSSRRSGDKGQIVEETALDVREALGNSLAAAQAGHWQEAESLRLDAYTSFDSEIEVRVLPRNPALANSTERSFIDGAEGSPGIKALLDRSAPVEELAAGYDRALKKMDECVSILKVAVSPATIGFTAFTIIAREGLEAIVILAALLAGMRGVEQRGTRRWVSTGAWLAILVSGLTFWLSKTLIQSLARYGEKLEAVISILAVIILLMVTNWVFHKFYWVGWNAKLRALSKSSRKTATDRWEWLALLGVGFLTVYREGFETTLFMQSLLLEGTVWPVVSGVLLGAAFIAAVGLGIFVFGAKLPYRKLLVVTGVLVVSIMVTFFGSTTRLFQTVGWLPIHSVKGLSVPIWMGTWLGLYPSWEGILIPMLAIVYVGGAWLWVKLSSRRAVAMVASDHAAPVPV